MVTELKADLKDTVDWGSKSLVDFNAGKTQLISFDRSNNTGAIDVKMDGSVLEEKSSFKMLGLPFSSKLDWASYIINVVKTASKKIGKKFLSPEVAFYLLQGYGECSFRTAMELTKKMQQFCDESCIYEGANLPIQMVGVLRFPTP